MNDDIRNIVNYLIYNRFYWNTLFEYIVAIALFFVTVIIVRAIKASLIKLFENLYKARWWQFFALCTELVKALKPWFYWTLYLYFPLKFLNLTPSLDNFIDNVLTVVIILQVIDLVIKIYNYFFHNYVVKKWEYDQNTYNVISYVISTTIRVIWILWLLGNIGINITPFIASLWISWLAVAFAARNILENVFATFMIYLDRPFVVGDYISLWWDKWVVKFIWLRSTKIQDSLWNLLIIPNKDFVNTRLYNHTKMDDRRLIYSVKIDYGVSLDQSKKILADLKNIVWWVSDVQLNRINLKNVSWWWLEYELEYHINILDYNLFMEKQQEVNFKLFEYFKNSEIKVV